MARLSAQSKLRHFTCYNTRLHLLNPTCVLFLLLCQWQTPLLPCPAISCLPGEPPLTDPQQQRTQSFPPPPTLQLSSATPRRPPPPTLFILFLKLATKSANQSFTYPTPLFRRKSLHSFVLWGEKKSGRARRTLELPPSAGGQPKPPPPQINFYIFSNPTCLLVWHQKTHLPS